MPSTQHDTPLFGAEDLRQIERVNAEIRRNGRAGRMGQPARPLFDTDQAADDAWSISYGSAKVGTVKV